VDPGVRSPTSFKKLKYSDESRELGFVLVINRW
jgi:hypothetical protein